MEASDEYLERNPSHRTATMVVIVEVMIGRFRPHPRLVGPDGSTRKSPSRQTRTKVLNSDLEGVFRGWYPQFHARAA